MTFGSRLSTLRKEKNMTQSDLAGFLGISRGTIGMYEIDKNDPDTATLLKLAEYFNVSVDYLLCKSDKRNNNILDEAYIPNKTIDLPIIGMVRAGEPLYAEQNILGYSSIDASLVPSGECFYLRVKGDSMNLSNIVEGQLVMIRRQEEIENGQIALVLVDGEDATIKKFYKTDTVVTLMPHSSNPEHQPRIIDLKKENVKVIGKVVGTFISF